MRFIRKPICDIDKTALAMRALFWVAATAAALGAAEAKDEPTIYKGLFVREPPPELSHGKEPQDHFYTPGTARDTGPFTLPGYGPEDQGGEGNIPPVIPPSTEAIEDLDVFQKGVVLCKEKFSQGGPLEKFYNTCIRALTVQFPKVVQSMPEMEDGTPMPKALDAPIPGTISPYLKSLAAFKCDGPNGKIKCSDAQIKARAAGVSGSDNVLPLMGLSGQAMYPVPTIYTHKLEKGVDPQYP